MFILFDQGRPLASFGSDIPRCVSDSELPGRGDVSRQIMADPLNRAMLLGDDAIPAAAALRRHVAEGVRVFLAAYGTRPSGKRQVKAARRSRRRSRA